MDFDLIAHLPQESTREFVYRFLKTNIMHLRMPPGTALTEQDIATLLSVSRTPVREAFIQLSQEHLLDIVPQKGTYVSLIDLDSVEESKFLRETLEKTVIKIACRQFPADKLFELQSCISIQELCLQEHNYLKFYELDEQLHRTIFAGCQKARIWNAMQQMNTHYNRVRLLNLASNLDFNELLQQHKNLVQAIREQDVTLGSKTIALHLNRVKLDLIELSREYPGYFRQPVKKLPPQYTHPLAARMQGNSPAKN